LRKNKNNRRRGSVLYLLEILARTLSSEMGLYSLYRVCALEIFEFISLASTLAQTFNVKHTPCIIGLGTSSLQHPNSLCSQPASLSCPAPLYPPCWFVCQRPKPLAGECTASCLTLSAHSPALTHLHIDYTTIVDQLWPENPANVIATESVGTPTVPVMSESYRRVASMLPGTSLPLKC
jgi:hypothetical protein